MVYSLMIKWLVFLIVVLITFVVYVRFVESRSVFFPHLCTGISTPEDVGLAFEDIFLKTADGLMLNGWFVPAANQTEKTVTLLFLHGNAGNINDRVGKVQLLHQIGVNVFIIDYRGYGRSEGRPSEKGIYLDALAAYDYLASRKDAGGRIIVYGVSLGGAPAVDMAIRRPVKGLILESTFTSAKDMAKKILPVAPGFLIKTELNSIGKIVKVNAPTLVIHSPRDEMVPFEMGRRLYEKAAGPKEFLEINGGHNEGYLESEHVWLAGIKGFLEKYF
ncbi:MAG: alpha/beta hydrolase [Candidatus Omnitrophota bacterium]